MLEHKFRRCLDERKLLKEKLDRNLMTKELEEAEYDLDKARVSTKEGDYKWATIKAYYSMFHSARALLFSKGYREKSHACLFVALGHLFVSTGELEKRYLNEFEKCMSLREDADYGYVYNSHNANESIQSAADFLAEIGRILGR